VDPGPGHTLDACTADIQGQATSAGCRHTLIFAAAFSPVHELEQDFGALPSSNELTLNICSVDRMEGGCCLCGITGRPPHPQIHPLQNHWKRHRGERISFNDTVAIALQTLVTQTESLTVIGQSLDPIA